MESYLYVHKFPRSATSNAPGAPRKVRVVGVPPPVRQQAHGDAVEQTPASSAKARAGPDHRPHPTRGSNQNSRPKWPKERPGTSPAPPPSHHQRDSIRYSPRAGAQHLQYPSARPETPRTAAPPPIPTAPTPPPSSSTRLPCTHSSFPEVRLTWRRARAPRPHSLPPIPKRAGASATTTLTFPSASSRQHVAPASTARVALKGATAPRASAFARRLLEKYGA